MDLDKDNNYHHHHHLFGSGNMAHNIHTHIYTHTQNIYDGQ